GRRGAKSVVKLGHRRQTTRPRVEKRGGALAVRGLEACLGWASCSSPPGQEGPGVVDPGPPERFGSTPSRFADSPCPGGELPLPFPKRFSQRVSMNGSSPSPHEGRGLGEGCCRPFSGVSRPPSPALPPLRRGRGNDQPS